MSLPATVAVIDIGKSNAKVVLVDRASGAAIASRSVANTVRRSGPYPHHDVDGLWRFILDALATLNRERAIEGISIATHGATAALIGETGLAMPVLDYEHDGPQENAEDYDAVRPPFAETLSPRLPNGLNLGAQLFWQARRFGQDFARAKAILMYPQYWAWRLTGVQASEVTSLGCHTDLWSPPAGTMSRLVAEQGWAPLLPPMREAISVLAPVQWEIGAAMGLAGDVPVACGIHDSNASLLPYMAAHAAPFTVISSGTWAIVMTVGGSTTGLDLERDSLAYVDAHGRAVPAARFMAGREFDILTGGTVVEPTESDIAAVLGRRAMALPGFVPGVGPYPMAHGRWTVPPDTLSPGERTAAASLYLALMSRCCLNLAGTGHFIAVEGPLARNSLYVGALAALTECNVYASADTTGTAGGAAMLFGDGVADSTLGEPAAPLAGQAFADYAAAWFAALGDGG